MYKMTHQCSSLMFFMDIIYNRSGTCPAGMQLLKRMKLFIMYKYEALQNILLNIKGWFYCIRKKCVCVCVSVLLFIINPGKLHMKLIKIFLWVSGS